MLERKQLIKRSYDQSSQVLQPLKQGDEVHVYNRRKRVWEKERILQVMSFWAHKVQVNGAMMIQRNKRELWPSSSKYNNNWEVLPAMVEFKEMEVSLGESLLEDERHPLNDGKMSQNEQENQHTICMIVGIY